MAVCARLIYDPLSFARAFTDFRELRSIRVAGAPSVFGEDKLKLDTFISARAAEEPVTANHKAFPLITPAQSAANGNRR